MTGAELAETGAGGFVAGLDLEGFLVAGDAFLLTSKGEEDIAEIALGLEEGGHYFDGALEVEEGVV